MKNLIKNLKFSWQYVKNDKKYLFIITIVNIIDIILNVITPILSAKIIIELTTNNFKRMILIAIMIFIVNFLSSMVHFIARTFSTKMYRNALSKIEVDLGSNMLKLDNNCLDSNSSGVFIQRLTNDTTRMADVFNSMLGIISTILKDVGVFIAIFIVNKIMFFYIIGTMLILYYLEKVRTDIRNKDDKEFRTYKEKVSGFIGELVRGARDIKMLNSENDFIGELDKRITTTNDKMRLMHTNSIKYSTINWIISDLFALIQIILLVVLIEKGYIISSIALVLYNYSKSVEHSIYTVGYFLEYIKDFNLSCERVIDILDDSKFSKEKFGTKHLDRVNGNFEFKDVTFSYDNKKLLRNLNFKINANETVAFVGKSGTGKTTIFNLLCKMYDVKKGIITIDGVDIKELDKDSIRGNITIISQNPYIFNMSIKDNLKLVKSDLTDKEMKDACKVACLDEFIKTLPDKYDTIIGEGGVNLSGGQKQRLAIARALVQKTEIILFDEATSALDNETQTQIQEAIENMKGEYTILIIAHRLSTIKNADRILYLEDGSIKAEGTHRELLKSCEGYKNLYESENIEK